MVIIYLCSFTFRLILHNPINILKYIFIDIRSYFRYRYIPKKPFINCYVGLFGSGKTLSAVHDVIDFYHTYNNRKVYDDRFNRWTIQKVFILSNVDLKTVPYRHFYALSQLNDIAKYRHQTDKRHNVRTITICLLDEASCQLNSRQYRDNFSISNLEAILQSRHYLIHGFYLTSQRFGHMDALMRQVTSNVISCEKKWRFLIQTYYDAWTYENCSKVSECPIVSRQGFFIQDKDFKSYDTLAVVDHLLKDQEQGNMIPDKDILENRGNNQRINVTLKNKKRGKK